MKHWIACDRRGAPLATVSATTQEQAEALALRKIVGVQRMVEVKSLSRGDLENRLTEAFKQLGYSEATAKTMATRNNVKNLRSYQAAKRAEASQAKTSSEVDAFVDRWANPERKLFETFKSMGMSEKEARTAAKTR